MTTPNPETFDLNAWLTDAKLPEESADVFKRADVIAELSEVERRLAEEDTAGAERTSADASPTAALEARHTELVKVFGESRLTVYVAALPAARLRELRAEHDAANEGVAPKDANIEFGYRLLAEAIVAVKPYDDIRQPVKLTVEQVKGLAAQIGEVQMSGILEARQVAQNAVPVVDADFLLRRSGTNADTAS